VMANSVIEKQAITAMPSQSRMRITKRRRRTAWSRHLSETGEVHPGRKMREVPESAGGTGDSTSGLHREL
jgi:hypothetical protein